MNVKVPGRMELLSSPDNKVTGLVDYAHNKLSYQKLFSSTSKEFPGYGRYVVMGAVGGKAYNRRQELPEEAAKWADLMIYTTEDWDPSDARKAFAPIRSGMSSPTRTSPIQNIPANPPVSMDWIDAAYA